MPPTAVLAGLLTIVSFSMSHFIVKVDGSGLCEPVLLWISICMPTGCAKSSLYSYLHKLVNKAWKKSVPDNGPLWCLGDQSFEKLGELMQENNGKILGLYDELPTFYHRSIFVVVEPWLNLSKCQHFSNCMEDVSGSAEQV